MIPAHAINLTTTESIGNDIVSKVLIYEHDKQALNFLNDFFKSKKLLGYKTTKDKLLRVMANCVDLAGIFVPQSDARGMDNLNLIIEIHRARPELPIFIRRATDDIKFDSNILSQLTLCAYTDNDTTQLGHLIDTYLFSRHYPSEFVKNIKDLSLEAFRSAFDGLSISVDPPYLIRDKIIYGELFSLMPLESAWCRGYMTLQTDETTVHQVISAGKTRMKIAEPTFRHVNAVLGELSNMIWGNFKTRYAQSDGTLRYRAEVPIIVNHARKFITFGSDDPQLCFRYLLSDPSGTIPPIVMYQKLIFSLDWSPEKYQENQQQMDAMVNSGELELF